MDYPTIDNFNPGGEDATLTNEVTGQRDQKISGAGPNGIRDKSGDDMWDADSEFPRH